MRSIPMAVAVAGCLALAAPAAAQHAHGAAMPKCAPTASGEKLTSRASRYDSTHVVVGGSHALVCYSRPAAKGRTMIGGEAVPFGKLWRTGANEPTIIHLPFAATIAGIDVEPGSYSIYTIPDKERWTVIVNRATSQWGHERQYTEEVRKQEVGRATVKSVAIPEHVELFTIRSTPMGANGADLVLEWEKTRVAVPIRKQAGPISPK